MDKKTLINDLRRVASKYQGRLTRESYRKDGVHSDSTVATYFGGWSKALSQAGIVTDREAEKEVDAQWEKTKEDLKAKAHDRKFKAIMAANAKKDLLKVMLNEAIQAADAPIVEVTPIKVVRPKDGLNRGNVTLWFNFSDLQLGTLMNSKDMGGLNEHNWLIWQTKLSVWKRGVMEKIREYLEGGYEIDQVIIACLGDMVEGQDIFKGQKWQIDRHVVYQAIDGANDTAAAFIEIMMSFQDLDFHVHEVFGNHGRTAQKGEAPYSCSMDNIYQRFIESQLGAAKVPNFTYHRNDAWFGFVDVYGWNHLLLHGDQGVGSMWSNRPTVNALEKLVVRYSQMFQAAVHFVHIGHFHNAWQLSFNLCQLLINGSFIGTSQFSASQMVAASPPEQSLHVFNEREGLIRTEHLYLTDGAVKKSLSPLKVSPKARG